MLLYEATLKCFLKPGPFIKFYTVFKSKASDGTLKTTDLPPSKKRRKFYEF